MAYYTHRVSGIIVFCTLVIVVHQCSLGIASTPVVVAAFCTSSYLDRRLTRTPTITSSLLCTTATMSISSGSSTQKKKSPAAAFQKRSTTSRRSPPYAGPRPELMKATDMYIKAVDAFCKSQQQHDVESILNYMKQLHETGQIQIPPNTSIVNALMNTLWTNDSKRPEQPAVGAGALKAQAMLILLEQQHQPPLQPNTVTYSIVIKALAKSGGGVEAAIEAEKILQKMHHLHEAPAISTSNAVVLVKPDVVTYGSVLDCWVNSGNVKKANDVLNQMIHLYQSDPIHHAALRPNTQIFSAVIHAWIKASYGSSNRREAAIQAQALLSQMELLYQTGLTQVKPNTISYSMVINAWAKSGQGVEAAMEAEKLLFRMLQQKDANVQPNVITYSSVINCWARSGHANAAENAEQILKDMIQRYQSNNDPNLAPNTQCFNSVINAWANYRLPSNSGNNSKAAIKAQALLSEMENMVSTSNSINTVPDVITYNTVIKALVNSGGGVKAAIEAEKLLQNMWQLYNTTNNNSIRPDVVTYASVIDCWAKSGAKDNAAEKAGSLLEEMIQFFQSDPIRHAALKPNTWIFSTVINSWAQVAGGKTTAAWKAQAILTEMENNMDNLPNVITYNTVIHAWAKSGGGEEACNEVEKILQKMHQLYKSGTNIHAKPNVSTYIAVIDCWAKKQTGGGGSYSNNNDSHAAEKAEQVLYEMIRIYRSDPIQNVGLTPNAQVFNAVINAWAKSGGTQAALKAQSILTRMKEAEEEQIMAIKPNTITYNTVINAWAKSGGGTEAATEAEMLLQKMWQLYNSTNDNNAKPDATTYVAVIDCWAKSGNRDAAEKADSILADMIHIYQSDPIKYVGLTPITQVFNAVINAWAKSGAGTQAALKAQTMLTTMENMRVHAGISDIKPDAITYNTVINAWAKSGGGTEAAIEAEKFLHKMHQIYNAGNLNMKPNVKTYGSVIDCWANAAGASTTHGDDTAAEKAERILDDMIKLHQSDPIKYSDLAPNTQVINTVINAWAKSGGSGKAQKMLSKMEKMCNEGASDMKPDIVTYNTVIKALAKSGGGVEAAAESEKLLQKMNQLYKSGNSSVKPNFVTYTSVVLSWLNSGSENAAERADKLLTNMMNIYQSDPIKHATMRPDNMRIFNTVQNSLTNKLRHHHSDDNMMTP